MDVPAEGQVYWQHMPIEPLGPQRQQMITRIQQLIPSGGTPLYSVTRKASEAVRAGAGDDKINAIVVMTDGQNEYPDDNDLDGLIRQLGDQAPEVASGCSPSPTAKTRTWTPSSGSPRRRALPRMTPPTR